LGSVGSSPFQQQHGRDSLTAEHKIEALSLERQGGEAGREVGLGMGQSIGEKRLEGFQLVRP